jgi:hypothetical protein
VAYALVQDDEIVSVGPLPRTATKPNGSTVYLRSASDEKLESLGYYEVVETPAPTPAQGNTVESTVELVNGIPTRVWTERPMTPEELLAQTRLANRTTLETNLDADIVTLQNTINTANATINANPAAYIKDTARAVRRLAKLQRGNLDQV